jgi:hypothetical protein
MAEYDVCEGFTLQHYGRDDWFPVVDAGWWEREWLMCTDECRVEVTSPEDDDMRASWGEIVAMLESLGNVGPYGEEPVFQALTYNSENSLSDELLITAGWVDVSEHALHRGMGSPLLRAIFAHMPEHAWDEIGRVWVVATARGGCYGRSDTVADVYVSPNMDDDYDVARWGAQMYATGDAGSHPIWDASGGFGDSISGLGDTTGYPWGQNEDRLPMYDVSDVSWDSERGCHEDGSGDILPATAAGTADGYLITYSGPWLACGSAGVFAIGTDGRVHRVWASVN